MMARRAQAHWGHATRRPREHGADGRMVLTLHLLGSVEGNDALFFPFVFLHAISALAGFGSIGFAGTYASRAAQIPYSGWAPTRGTVEVLGAASVPGEVDLAQPGVRAGEPLAGTTVVQAGSSGSGGPAAAAVGSELDPESEELMRYFRRPARFWKAILLVPVFGLLALWAQPRTAGLDQVWTLAALLVWIAACLLVISVVMPGLRQMRSMLLMPGASSDSPAAEAAWSARLARAGAMASRGAVVGDVLFFVALALMIWRP